jgi:class 3 adenylate cyclase
MKAALERHHALLHGAIRAHGGYVCQIVGDAFCAAFRTAPEAMAAALAAQRALTGERWGETGPLRVRMALHTGTAEVQSDEYRSGEYASGLTLSRAARLLATGHGGQILLSRTTRDLAGDQLPPDVGLRDLGERRLRDLVNPEHIFQIAGARSAEWTRA